MVFFVGGVHKHTIDLGDRLLTCPICHRMSSMHFSLRKRAVHFFWIPLYPAGSTAYVKCTLCGHEWEATDAPHDTPFYGFLGLSLLFTILGVLVVIYAQPTCVPAIPFVVLNIVLSGAYMITVPGTYAGYPPGNPITQAPPTLGISTPVQPYQSASPSYQSGHYTSPALATSRSSVTYDKDSTLRAQSGGLYAENHCPYCGTAMPPVPPGQVITCGYCKNQIAT
jgi:hypothetical protein